MDDLILLASMVVIEVYGQYNIMETEDVIGIYTPELKLALMFIAT